MLSISDAQAEIIASEVYARNPVDGIDAAFKLDWELVRAGISHAKAISTEDSCPHGNTHIVHDCLRCGAPVCCGKCCADDSANEPDVAGEIAYQLTKKLVIDMPTARAAVDAALAARGAVPAGLPEIDYEALIKAAYARDKKWAQGTNGCIAFKHGAEWFRDQVAAAPQQVAQPWMPIETAPKDGTRVLLVIDHGEWGDKIWTGLWANGWMVSYGKTSNPPTHWMPLPAAPQKPKD